VPPAPALPPAPAVPAGLTVFPERDYVSGTNFAPGAPVSFTVTRGGAVLATGSVVAAANGLAEINHPGGSCWAPSTPDILPGDVVTAVQDTTTVTTTVADIKVGAPVQTGARTIVVNGTAQTATGVPIPVAQLEGRLISRTLFSNGKRDLRAVPAYTAGTAFTATYTLPRTSDAAIALASQSRGLWIGTPGLAANTIFELGGVVPGPQAPCTA
jgi:hypothetical protein